MIRGFLLLLLVAGCTSQAEQPIEPVASDVLVQPSDPLPTLGRDTLDKLHAYFDSMARSGRFSGVVLTARDHRIYKEKFGYRKLQERDTFDFGDQFQLASLSKPVTAFGLLLLADRGLIELDAPVQQYLFDFPFEGVTVRSLLSHTSGIGNYIYITDSLWNNPDSFMTNDNVYDLIRCDHLPKYYPPLKRFDYCNTNFALIPILIEAVTGQPFSEFMKEEVFEPVGMFDTEYLNPFEKSPDDYPVVGHYPNGLPKRAFYLDGVVGDKSLYSTVYDLYKFYIELKHPSIISANIIEEAMEPQAKTSYDRFYGLGWRIAGLNEQDTIVFHNGWWRGFRSYFWMSKHEEKVAIILTNSIRGGYLDQQAIWSMY